MGSSPGVIRYILSWLTQKHCSVNSAQSMHKNTLFQVCNGQLISSLWRNIRTQMKKTGTRTTSFKHATYLKCFCHFVKRTHPRAEVTTFLKDFKPWRRRWLNSGVFPSSPVQVQSRDAHCSYPRTNKGMTQSPADIRKMKPGYQAIVAA